MRLMPSGERFFETFSGLATRLTKAAQLLARMFGEPANRVALAAEIRTIEQEADAIAHDVKAHIAKSFVTPLDRDDIHLLVTRLDNAIDMVDDIAQRALIFHIGSPRPAAGQLADILVRATRQLEGGVRDIKKPKSAMQQMSVVKQLEEEADAVFQEAVTELFTGKPDPMEVLKWKELYQRLEDATDECQHTARVIETIVMTRG